MIEELKKLFLQMDLDKDSGLSYMEVRKKLEELIVYYDVDRE
jgi:hypothetical protein